MATAIEAADQEERAEGWHNWSWSSWSGGQWSDENKWWSWSHVGANASNGWRGGQWKDGAWGDSSASKALAEVNLTEANKNKEQVINECREHMGSPGKSQLLLCALGAALSPAARLYLKKTHQGLKDFMSQYPEFSLDGPKGQERISYLPALDRGGSDVPEQLADLPAPARGGQNSDSSEMPERTDLPAPAHSSDLPAVEESHESVESETLAPTPRYWCPACSQGFVMWSQCKRHIFKEGKCERVLQQVCSTKPKFQ